MDSDQRGIAGKGKDVYKNLKIECSFYIICFPRFETHPLGWCRAVGLTVAIGIDSIVFIVMSCEIWCEILYK